MTDSYSFTGEGLRFMALAGVDPADVWSALLAAPSLRRHLPDGGLLHYAQADSGAYVLVRLDEAADDHDWDISAARRMDADEVARFQQFLRGEHD